MPGERTDGDRLDRLRSVRKQVREAADFGRPFLDVMGYYGADPLTERPYLVPQSFIAERVGGSVAVIDQNDEFLADENLNQFCSSFLPCGYKQRWRDFDLYRGNWDFDAPSGFADVAPMLERADVYDLSTILDGADEIPYGPIAFDPDDVRVYVPETVRVTNENLDGAARDIDYVWLPEEGIVWAGDPPVSSKRRLSSDPTTNVLWFKHPRDEVPAPTTPIDDTDVLSGFAFEDAVEFVRCYYASLLTLYPADSTETMSGVVRYRHEADDAVAFVGSEEQSQLFTVGIERSAARDRIETVLSELPSLERDLRFALLHVRIWERLFFQEEAIPHEFAVEPLLEHLRGIDSELQRHEDSDLGVFHPQVDLETELERLLPKEGTTGTSAGRLRLLGYPPADDSTTYEIVAEYGDELARTLAICRNDDRLLDFAEQVLVHSAEHALANWSNEYTGSGTSFELWYDVNFQERDDEEARIAVYDPIQGGAGIAKEVADTYEADDDGDLAAGIRSQSRCHTGAADRTALELMAEIDGASLYDLYHDDREQVLELIRETVDEIVTDPDQYNRGDLVTLVEHRIQALLETRSLATFYSYVADRYDDVVATVGRTPRVVDLALYLDQHVFREPDVRATYEQFASDTGRRDLAELDERLQELTVGCVDACPDCLETDPGRCLHGSGPQQAWLDRRLLTEVFDDR